MTLVDAGEEEGAIEQEEKEMIYSIFQLDETLASRDHGASHRHHRARDQHTLDQAIDVIRKAGHSRIPLTKSRLITLKGSVRQGFSDVWNGRGEYNLKTLLRPASCA